MKSRAHKRLALLAFILLLIGLPCVVCFVWVRKEQRQYALDRQLIAALKVGDLNQATFLMKSGADTNTRVLLLPAPNLSGLVHKMLHRSQTELQNGPTALMITCGAEWTTSNAKEPHHIKDFDSHSDNIVLMKARTESLRLLKAAGAK